MGGVLGVSVGSGFVRIVRRRQPADRRGFGLVERRTLVVGDQDPARLAAEAVGVLLAGDEESGSTPVVSIAYGGEAQAAALDSAMRREGLTGYRLVPELSAVFEHLSATGSLAGFGTVVVIDLGWSGSIVSVVETGTGAVRATERTPASATRIEESVDLADELLTQSGCTADAVILVGGGAHTASIRERVTDLAGLRAVVPEDPEFSAASGAALSGGASRVSYTTSRLPEPRRRGAGRGVSRRQVRGAGAAGVLLALLAVVGFGLGYGRTLFGSISDESAGKPVTSSVRVVSTPPSIPPSIAEPVGAQAPRTEPAADTPAR